MANGKLTQTSSQAVQAKLRAVRALDLRARYWSYTDIGKDLGITASSAAKLVKNALSRLPTEDAEKVRQMELDRLDALAKRLEEDIEKGGDLSKNTYALMQIAARRSKLLGLDLQAKNDDDEKKFTLNIKLGDDKNTVISADGE